MFCPLCRSEFREGVTVCSDCHVALVPTLPEVQEQVADDQRPEGYLMPLWTGEDLLLHDQLLESLDAAGIHFYDQTAGLDPRARRDDPLFIGRRPHFGFEVMVSSSQLAAGEQILDKLLEAELEDVSLPAGDDNESQAPPPMPDIQEKPTCEIWLGENQEIVAFVEAALSENEILFRTENTWQGVAVYVRPSDESRAREILREILEASPPA